MHGASVEVFEESITMPTYELGPEDQNPPLFIPRLSITHPGTPIIYPYPLNENITLNRGERAWNAIVLENQYLRLTIIPELGGRLVSAIDKITGDEVLYRNHVVKYARIGIRGAWISGGIEWNFPNGHTVTTVSPIDYAIRQNEDGSVTVVVGDIERVSRMKWSVGITLFPDKSYFETEMCLYNRTPFRNRFWFWANSAAPASDGLQFITTATKVMTLTDIWSFPKHGGVDISWHKNHLEPQDMFSLDMKEDFVGWYNYDLDRGMIHVANRHLSRGRKFYTWGNSDDGMIWVDFLTDNDGPYAEVQSGRLITQRVWKFMEPHTVEKWKECWYPVRKIGSPVYANKEAALNLESLCDDGKETVLISVHTTSSYPNAKVLLKVGETVFFERVVDLDPKTTFLEKVPLSSKKYGNEVISLILQDSSGRSLASYSNNVKAESGKEIEEEIWIRPESGESVEELYLAGLNYEKLGEEDRAMEMYRKVLEKDPGFSQALCAVGILHFRHGEYDSSEKALRASLIRNQNYEKARYYLALVLKEQEQYETAEEEFWMLERSVTYGYLAFYFLGGMSLMKGEYFQAAEHFKVSASRNSEDDLKCLDFLAVTMRKQGNLEEAKNILKNVLNKDPLDFMAQYELYLVENEEIEKTKLVKLMRNEVQSYLELATDYEEFGLYQEAIGVLSTYLSVARKDPQEVYPLIYYYLGYFHEKLGSVNEALEYYTLGSRASNKYVFPHRLKDIKILNSVLERNSGDGRAMYYLGNLLCARNRPKEAIKLWEESAKLEGNFSVVHRNLGLAYWKVENNLEAAIEEYEKALECDPNDYKLYYELDKLYAYAQQNDKRRELMEGIPADLAKHDMIAERIACTYVDIGEFDRALQVLKNTVFFPREFYAESRCLYVDANIGKGLELLEKGQYLEAICAFKEVMKYPRNLGVGEPVNKRNAEALYFIGLVYEAIGNLEKAKICWEEAANEKHPEWTDLRYYEALALKKLGERDKAESVLNELISFAKGEIARGQEEASSHYLLGLGYKGKGDMESSIREFKRALEIDPTYRRARWQLSRPIGQ